MATGCQEIQAIKPLNVSLFILTLGGFEHVTLLFTQVYIQITVLSVFALTRHYEHPPQL